MPSPQTRYLPELDGLRAIAVLLVVTVHMHAPAWHVLNGHLGVILFFVLSGYLITSIALREEASLGRLHLRAFFIRRSFRIFPLYYLVLALYCLLIFGLGISPEKRQLLAWELPWFLTYLQEIPFFGAAAHPQGPFYQSWSLGIEEKFYLVWPVLCFVVFRYRRTLRLPVACALIAVTAYTGSYIGPYAYILTGCVLALALQHKTVRFTVINAGAPLAWLCFTALVLLQLYGAAVPLLYAAVTALALASLLLLKTPFNTLLAWRPLAWIGRLSYGIYLIHILCLNVAERLTHNRPLPAFLATVALSIGVAAILHTTIEKPLIRRGRQLAAAREPNPTSNLNPNSNPNPNPEAQSLTPAT